jgi:tetratricopeptide (TPR) repeat protein
MAAVGNTLNFLGNIYRDLGLYSQALKVYDESIGIGKSSKSASLEAASIAGRAYTELELGQYDVAIAGFEQALKLRRTLNFPPLEGLTLNNLGIAYAATNQPQMAQVAYQQGIRITTDPKAKPMVFTQWLRWNQANLKFATQGDASDFSPGKPGFVPLDQIDRRNYGAFLNNLALVYEADGRPDEALKIYSDALQAFVPTGNFSCQRTALHNQGRLLAQQGQMERAIAAYYEAIGVTLRVLRDGNLSTAEKASYRSMVTPLYQELAALLKQQGREPDAQAVLKQLEQ